MDSMPLSTEFSVCQHAVEWSETATGFRVNLHLFSAMSRMVAEADLVSLSCNFSC